MNYFTWQKCYNTTHEKRHFRSDTADGDAADARWLSRCPRRRKACRAHRRRRRARPVPPRDDGGGPRPSLRSPPRAGGEGVPPGCRAHPSPRRHYRYGILGVPQACEVRKVLRRLCACRRAAVLLRGGAARAGRLLHTPGGRRPAAPLPLQHAFAGEGDNVFF